MNKMIYALMLAGAAACLTGCAEDYYYGGYTPGRALYYDGFYDGFYGAPYAGYWDPDGFFYYTPGPGRPYVRDADRHFRRSPFRGASAFHMRDAGEHPRGAPGHSGDDAHANRNDGRGR